MGVERKPQAHNHVLVFRILWTATTLPAVAMILKKSPENSFAHFVLKSTEVPLNEAPNETSGASERRNTDPNAPCGPLERVKLRMMQQSDRN